MDCTMRWFLLFLSVTLTACQNISYEPGFDPKKTYEYKYEGVITIGRDMPDLAESGMRLICSVRIIGVSAQTFLLQVSSLAFEEFNGFPGKSGFNPSPKLTERIAAQLTKPVMFEYVKGRIGDIRAAAEVSNTAVNIIRGILGFLQVTIKTTQNVYELDELGIHGICHSNYFIEEDQDLKEFYVTQVVDVDNCQERAAMYSGMTLALQNKYCKERGDNLKTAVEYTYTVRPTDNGALIIKGHAQELQFLSPFNVNGGTSKLKAIKDIVLVSVMDTVANPGIGPLENRGNLMYKFGNELNQIPLFLIKSDNPVAKISELIQRLAQANINQVDSASSADVLHLYQLLRVATQDNLEALWKQFSGNAEHRRWLLDSVVEVTDARVIQFLKDRFQEGDLTANEAGQTLLVAFHHLTADSANIELAKEFLKMPFSRTPEMLWNTIVLAYGSLVYRYCGNIDPCPVAAVQPLLDLAIDGLNKDSEEEVVLALKALGNAGHPSSIKTIMRFLPGISPAGAALPTRVLNAAVQSLRLIAVRDPRSVQDIALSLFVKRDLDSEVRMLACMILFETKPPFALVSTVAAFLLEETNLQVASFSYSLISGLARSLTPDNHYLSSACDVAVKILGDKLGHLSYRYSKARQWDWFNDAFLFGAASDIYILHNAASFFPTAVMFKGKAYFIGRILQLLELGVRAEGIKELFSDIPPLFNWESNIVKIKAVLKLLADWQSLPKDKPLLSVFARAFGQEVLFADINRDMIQSTIQALNLIAGKESPVWKMVEDLQKRIAWHWTKPYLVFETRYIQATSLGLPSEISKYYSTVTGITVNAKATLSPSPTDNLGQLLNSDIVIQTDGNAGVTNDISVFHGINTVMFQFGTELQSKTIVNLPWKFAMNLSVKSRKIQIDISPCQNDTGLFSMNFDVYAVSRNIEDPPGSIMTPMMAGPKEANEHNAESFKQKNGTSEQEQTGSLSEVYHEKNQMCVDATVYGTAICMEAETKRTHYTEEYPLYYFLGFTHFALKLQPVPTSKPIDKIHIEINAGPNKAVYAFSQMLELLRHAKNTRKTQQSGHLGHQSSASQVFQLLDAALDPVATLLALAMSGSAKPDGYGAVAYFTQAAQQHDMQLLVSQVGEEANWKLCTDANLDEAHSKTKIHLRWGAECQTYKMLITAATSHMPGSHPSLYSSIQWESMPVLMKELGKRIQEYMPGMAFLLGFYQKHVKNPANQASALVVAASSKSIDLKIKIPELTVYRQAIPLPFPIDNFAERYQQSNGFAELPLFMLKSVNAQCSISGSKFKTFNNIRFRAAMPKDCYLVLAQDCTTDLKFLVLMREGMHNKTEITIRTPIGFLNMCYKTSGAPLMKLNDSPISLSALPLKDPSGKLLIGKSDGGIVIQAPTLGLHSLYFDGKTIKVVIESWMRGKTCGLCGLADGETNTEFRKPNLRIAKSPTHFLNSWVLHGEACSDTCSLRRQKVKLEKMVRVLGAQSSCQSLEPVLRCREGCSPTSTAEHLLGFQCVPLNSVVEPKSAFNNGTVHVEEFVDEHTSCVCNPNDCVAV
ncbi:vitellogenin 3, phosvitinless [Anguilla rostrata]|uniref:vitellogenin 3, phosvitinless n=1 Tax=Anguilla rostrata TaxID=7938 RepID=UPI0030CB0E3C